MLTRYDQFCYFGTSFHDFLCNSCNKIITSIKFRRGFMLNSFHHVSLIHQQLRLSASQILHRNITNRGKKFTTSGWFNSIENINKFFRKKNNSSKTILKQSDLNKEEQVMEKYYEDGRQVIPELIEDYKYYTQMSVIFDPSFYKTMHSYREKKKMLDFNKLKAALHNELDIIQTQSESGKKSIAEKVHFNLLSQLASTYATNQESILLQKLKNKLQKKLGPNFHNTIEDLDKNYKFDNKLTESTICSRKKEEKKKQNKHKLSTDGNHQLKGQKFKKKRNKSCQSLMSRSPTKQPKLKKTKLKGHHKSITDIYNSPSTHAPSKYSHTSTISVLCKTSALRQESPKVIKPRTARNDGKQMKLKIVKFKDHIKKQKQMLKKKKANKLLRTSQYACLKKIQVNSPRRVF